MKILAVPWIVKEKNNSFLHNNGADKDFTKVAPSHTVSHMATLICMYLSVQHKPAHIICTCTFLYAVDLFAKPFPKSPGKYTP